MKKLFTEININGVSYCLDKLSPEKFLRKWYVEYVENKYYIPNESNSFLDEFFKQLISFSKSNKTHINLYLQHPNNITELFEITKL